VSSDTTGALAPLKRFLAIFLTVWAVVFAYLGITNDGTPRIVFLIAAVVCLVCGVFFFRSFAFVQGKEF
jgi:predicted membrane channel-forming protein YqfA (hemolysin III family)